MIQGRVSPRRARIAGRPERALPWHARAFSIYTTRGMYEDAILYGEAALALMARHCPNDQPRRWNLAGKLTELHRSVLLYNIALTALRGGG